MEKRRIVITGLGAITPLGNSVEEFWEGLKNGRSGIDRIKSFNPADYDLPSQIAGEIKNFDPLNYIDKKIVRRTDKFTHYALAAAQEAIKDAGIDKEGTVDKKRVAVLVGSGVGGLHVFVEQVRNMDKFGHKKVNPNFISMLITDTASAYISILYGFMGPNYSMSSACATGNHSIITAYLTIKHGFADVAITGGTEGTINPLAIAGFTQIHALSTRNDEPQKASRPFDRGRDGFVIAEGAGIIVLEELEHAKKRGAKIYAELAGVGESGDAYHPVAPHPEGDGACLSMMMALEDAGISPEDVQLVNTHGTSTPVGDKAEIKALKKVFGNHAEKLFINSTKSMTGHMLGAAGGAEAVAVAKMIENGFVHPTANLENPDDEFEGLNFVPKKGVEADITYAISNSFGFGGHNATLVIKKFEE